MTMCIVCGSRFGHSQETLAERHAKLVMEVSPASVSGVAPVSPSPGIPSPAAGEWRGIEKCSCEESQHLRAAIAHIARLVNQEDFDRAQLAFDVNMIIAAALCLLPLPPEE